MPNIYSMRVPLLHSGAPGDSEPSSASRTSAHAPAKTAEKENKTMQLQTASVSGSTQVAAPTIVEQIFNSLGLDIAWQRLADAWGRPGLAPQAAPPIAADASVATAPKTERLALRQRRGTPPAPWAWPNRIVTTKR